MRPSGDLILSAISKLPFQPVAGNASPDEARPSGYWALEFYVDEENRVLQVMPVLSASNFDAWWPERAVTVGEVVGGSIDEIHHELLPSLRAAAMGLALPRASNPNPPLAAQVRGIPFIFLPKVDGINRTICDVALGSAMPTLASFMAMRNDTRNDAVLVRESELSMVEVEEGSSSFGRVSRTYQWSTLDAFEVDDSFIRLVHDGELLSWRHRRGTPTTEVLAANAVAARNNVGADWRGKKRP